MLKAREIHRLYKNPLPSTRSGALYNAFSYPTKISPEAIAVFIATHTRPGDVVLDTFGGSGTTGLAALLCDRPTKLMRQIADDLGVKPQWGPRRAVLYEIGVLGSFIATTMSSNIDPVAFSEVAQKLIDTVERKTSNLYAAVDPNGQTGTIRHMIWSDVLVCPKCRKESLYWDAVVRFKPLRLNNQFTCCYCKHKADIESVEKATETVFDKILKKRIVCKKRRLARVHGETNGKNWQRPASVDDERCCKEIEKRSLPKTAPNIPIHWGDLYRSGYHTGISHLHHFYTHRNFLALAMLWEEIDRAPKAFRHALQLLILSYNSTHSTLMTRVVLKQGQKDFILTGSQSGVLYISSLPVEKNVFTGLRRKIKTFGKAFSLLHGSASRVEVVTQSSAKLKLRGASVDYVFTDPPFGDYIPYAEVNQLNEAWLGTMTDRKGEIIVSQAQGKSIGAYGRLMALVFKEIARTLKAKSMMTVVFHSAKADVWKELTQAYTQAGFSVIATSVLDKIQVSFKQVVSTVSVKGDPLLLFDKAPASVEQKNHVSARERIIKAILQEAEINSLQPKEKTRERLYSRFITKCLEQNVPVEIDAGNFYERLQNGHNGTTTPISAGAQLQEYV